MKCYEKYRIALTDEEIFGDTAKMYKRYKVYKDGRVLGTNGGFKKPQKQKGYSAFMFYDHCQCEVVYLHRLLAILWIPNPDNKNIVNHKDGNKDNNSLDNLEWVTIAENNKHAVINKLWTAPSIGRGRFHFGIRPVVKIDGNNDIVGEYLSVNEAARKNKCDVSAICKAIKNRHRNFGYYYDYK